MLTTEPEVLQNSLNPLMSLRAEPCGFAAIHLMRLVVMQPSKLMTRVRFTYANWYVRALLWLDAGGVDSMLIELLQEEKYLGEAGRGLLQLAVPPNRGKPFFGNTTDFEAIWTARAGARPTGFDAACAKRYAQALTQRITALKQESVDAAQQQYYVGRIKDLAVLLAVLDGRDSADLVIETLTMPGQWDGHVRVDGIRALLMSGATLSLDKRRRQADGPVGPIASWCGNERK